MKMGADYLNADVAGIFVIDELISATAAQTIALAINRGENLTAAPVLRHCEGCSQSCNLLSMGQINKTCDSGYTSQPAICASLYFSARACANFFSILPGSPKLASMASRDSLPRYLLCAEEGAYCLCHGLVRYGVAGAGPEHSTEPRLVAGGIMCANQIFEDPSPGRTKMCECLASPTYNATGGPDGNGHIKFERSKSQFLDAGNNTFEISSNGGLTVITVLRFTGSPGYYERIIDFGNGRRVDTLIIARYQTTPSLHILFGNGDGPYLCNLMVENVLEQDTWLTVIVRYDASDDFLEARVEGRGAANQTCSGALRDRDISLGTYVGRSHWYGVASDEFLDAEIAGFFVIDEYLSMHAIKALEKSMYRGEDLTLPNCTACKPGKYLDGTGTTGSTTTLVDSWIITGRPLFNVQFRVSPFVVLFLFSARSNQNSIVLNSRDDNGWGTEERINFYSGERRASWMVRVDQAGYHIVDGDSGQELYLYQHRQDWYVLPPPLCLFGTDAKH